MNRATLLCAIATLPGCASDALSETTWEVTRVTETSTSAITLQFRGDGTYGLRSGTCHGDGGYETTGDRIAFSPPASTREACAPGPGMELVWSELGNSFERLTRWSVSASVLTLDGDDLVVTARRD